MPTTFYQQTDSVKTDTLQKTVIPDTTVTPAAALLEKDSTGTASDSGSVSPHLFRSDSGVIKNQPGASDTLPPGTKGIPRSVAGRYSESSIVGKKITEQGKAVIYNSSSNILYNSPDIIGQEGVPSTDTLKIGTISPGYSGVNSHSGFFHSRLSELPSAATGLPQPVKEKSVYELGDGWFAIILIVIIALIARVNSTYNKRLRDLFVAFASNRLIQQLVREENAFTNRASHLLFVAFIMVTGLLFCQADIHYNWGMLSGSIVMRFIKSFLYIAGFYTIKIALIRLCGELFMVREVIKEYIFNLLLFNNILGILLLPFALAISFMQVLNSGYLIVAVGAIGAVSFITRLLKSYFRGSAIAGIPQLYIILYLCALEILPLAVLIKLFIGRNN